MFRALSRCWRACQSKAVKLPFDSFFVRLNLKKNTAVAMELPLVRVRIWCKAVRRPILLFLEYDIFLGNPGGAILSLLVLVMPLSFR